MHVQTQLLLTLRSLFCVLAADFVCFKPLITFVESLSDLLTMAYKHWLVAYLNVTISGRYSWAYLISGTGWDGTGQFQKLHIPNFQDAMVMEIPTCCLKSRIMEI